MTATLTIADLAATFRADLAEHQKMLASSLRSLVSHGWIIVVRPSALAFDELPPVVDGLAAGTTVIRSLPVLDSLPGVRLCPKTDPRDGRNNCEDCRSCFDGSEPVAYLEH